MSARRSPVRSGLRVLLGLLVRALEDLRSLPAAALAERRHADYTTAPARWTLAELVARYFVPRSRMSIDPARFYAGASDPHAIAVIDAQLAAVRELGIHRGHSGEQCLGGFTFRVATMLGGRSKVAGGLTAVKRRDIRVNRGRTHCGLVTRVGPQLASGPAGDYPAIWITNSSSRLHRVSLDRFDAYFKSEGEFFR